ncbi:MAG: hypothetical protein ABIP75_16505, partial [Pyrinomonadaceae bacterium]
RWSGGHDRSVRSADRSGKAMSANPDHARELARRIAARLSANPAAASSGTPGDLSVLRSTLAEIRQRLDRIEAQITPGSNSSAPPTAAYSPWTPPAVHASQERFDVEEAAVTDLVNYFESSKKCDMEPGNKPCDHCSMCSSRGF